MNEDIKQQQMIKDLKAQGLSEVKIQSMQNYAISLRQAFPRMPEGKLMKRVEKQYNVKFGK
jgi:hypothetical protein